MPRYFFNVHDGADSPNCEGIELSDVQAARGQAMILVAEIIRDAGMRGDPGEEWRVQVTDAAGLILFRLDFTVAETSATGRVSRHQDHLMMRL